MRRDVAHSLFGRELVDKHKIGGQLNYISLPKLPKIQSSLSPL